MGIRRWVQRISASFVAIVATLVITGTPAHAIGNLNGRFPQDIPSCVPNVHIGTWFNIYDYAGNYFGTAEWRYATTGVCADYQFVQLHFYTNTITNDYFFYTGLTGPGGQDAFTSNVPSPVHIFQYGEFTSSGPPSNGLYNTGIIYAKDRQICASAQQISVKSGTYFLFGTTPGVPSSFCA
jgi:hypothetical protein